MVTRDPRNPGAADHTLYQLSVMYKESQKYKSQEYKVMSNIVRYSDAQVISNEHYTPFYESL